MRQFAGGRGDGWVFRILANLIGRVVKPFADDDE